MRGTPASSQIIWLEDKVKEQADEIERLRGVLREIADAKISGVIDDGYNVRDWLIKHHVIFCLLYTSPSPRDS